MGDYDELRAAIALRFRSGNSVPIERAHVTADEWAALLAERDALAADAARYRWLRDRAWATGSKECPCVHMTDAKGRSLPGDDGALAGADLDAAIDAARGEEG